MFLIAVNARGFLQCASVFVVLMLPACSSHPRVAEAHLDLPSSFSHAGGQYPVADRWWQLFQDAHLDALVVQAFDSNPGLKASYQRLRQARAVADRQGASRLPGLNADVGFQRQATRELDSEHFSVSTSASYELDLWGRISALSEGAARRAAATEEDYWAAGVSLSSEVATAWFQLVEQRAQHALASTQLDTNRHILTMLETRFGTGQSQSADVLRQRQLVTVSLERLNSVAGEIELLTHQLMVLIGQVPGQGALPERGELPALPLLPETGVPAALLQRRPDLKKAWQLIEAADRDLAAALANRFPRFSLTASVRSEAGSTDNLFDDWLASLAGNLLVPLFDGGERRAEVRRTRAVLAESLQTYRQTVLSAIREVEAALIREQQLRSQLQSLEDQIQLADTTYRLLQQQYLHGAVGYIDVLSALQGIQDLQRTRLTSQQRLLVNRVTLYRALAGRIDMEEKEK